MKERKRCPHGVTANGYLCVQCKGGGICIHLVRKKTCKKCRGSSICRRSGCDKQTYVGP